LKTPLKYRAPLIIFVDESSDTLEVYASKSEVRNLKGLADFGGVSCAVEVSNSEIGTTGNPLKAVTFQCKNSSDLPLLISNIIGVGYTLIEAT
jgi:hypothetical protein